MTFKAHCKSKLVKGTRANQDFDNVKIFMVQHSYKILTHLVVV